ncbi:ER protein Pkr1-domain-containing protein [Panaeolus papilionaceus]|nr:ER protein Pkr1-domain-containing protein [Panaeolus papilionaceus]
MSNNEVPSDSSSDSFFSNILTPGSSLHPTFILILDASFAALFAVLVGLLFLTSGNIHFFALIMIELCLWGSVKWFVNELKNSSLAAPPPTTEDSSNDAPSTKPKSQ